MTRLARGSMPWPKLAPDGTPWLAIEFTLYPRGGRVPVHKQTS